MIETVTKSERFSENGEQIYDFGDEFFVICPKCAAMAKVVPIDNPEISSRRKIICSNCGYIKPTNLSKNSGGISSVEFSSQKTTKSYIVIGGAFDWYFRESLWLQTNVAAKRSGLTTKSIWDLSKTTSRRNFEPERRTRINLWRAVCRNG